MNRSTPVGKLHRKAKILGGIGTRYYTAEAVTTKKHATEKLEFEGIC